MLKLRERSGIEVLLTGRSITESGNGLISNLWLEIGREIIGYERVGGWVLAQRRVENGCIWRTGLRVVTR